MSVADLAIVAALVFGWGTLSARLERFDVTALEAFLKTTPLDVRQWLICLAVSLSLSIVVVTEIGKAVSRAQVLRNHPAKGDDTPQSLAQNLNTGSNRAGPDGGHASQPAA